MSDASDIVTYKIIITGPFSSGRTTFIQTIDETEIPPELSQLMLKTIAMDFGRITSSDNTTVLYLFGLPDGRRFDFVWEIMADGILGFIVMIDSRHPEMFREIRGIAQVLAVYAPVPYIFSANFQDVPDAWDVDALRIALQVPKEIPIIPCVATHKDSVKAVIIALMEEVLENITNPLEEDQTNKSLNQDESENINP